MVNVWLIIVAIVMVVLLIIANFYILVNFQSPEDKNVAWFPKIVVMSSLLLAELTILMLPYDVANRSTAGGIPMTDLWFALYIIDAVFIVFLIPFAMYFYESDDYESGISGQIGSALKAGLFGIIVFAILTTVAYLFLGIAEVPIQKLSASLVPADRAIGGVGDCINYDCLREDITVKYRVSIVLFGISVITFFGYVLLVVFGGIGLVALPFDSINDYRFRPKRIGLDKFLEGQTQMFERATFLRKIGDDIRAKEKSGKKRKQKEYNQFKQAVYLLEKDYNRLTVARDPKLYELRVVWYLSMLVFGVFGTMLSIFWFIHIILYVVTPTPIHPFLNNILIALDNAAGLLGTVFYGFFAFYLLLATIKGLFKVGLRILWIPIHPMRVGETMMNSFLFNMLFVLMSALTISQFCAIAFSKYAAATAVSEIFDLSIDNLRGFKYFWDVFVWIMLALQPLTLFWLWIKPQEKPAAIYR